MKKAIILFALIVIVIAMASFWYFNKGDKGISSSTKNIDSSKSSSGIKKQTTPDGKWLVQQQDDVFAGYEILELFAGETIKKLVSAKSTYVNGSFSIKENTLSGAILETDLSKLQSDNINGDERLASQGLETDKFPKAQFVQTKDVLISESITKNREIAFEVQGSLTLHGQTKPVIFPLKATWDGKVMKVSGELEILLVDYGIEVPKNSFLSIDDKGTLKLQLLFVPSN